jgi:hypothetical protein
VFAKIATFRATGPQLGSQRAGALAHSNDNKINAGGAMASHRTRRPILACRWRPFAGGGLECHWDVEIADGTAIAEPDQPWAIRRLFRLFGFGTGSGGLALPALG